MESSRRLSQIASPMQVPASVQVSAPGLPWRRELLLVGLLVIATALVRLPCLTRPLVGQFATKNVVYAMIARNWAEGRASLLTPTLDCLADGKASWHLVEFPVSAYVTALAWQICGGSLDVWGRVTSLVECCLSAVLLYWIVRRFLSVAGAVAATLVFALAPVSVIYGQAFMLEASVVLLSLGAIWTALKCRERGGLVWLVALGVCLTLLWLTKIYALVLLLPLLAIVFQTTDDDNQVAQREVAHASRSTRRRLVMCAAMAIAMIVALSWYAYAWKLSDPRSETAARVFYSVRDSAAAHWPPALLWSWSFYRGLVIDLATVALTPIGFVLAVCGLFDRRLWDRRLFDWHRRTVVWWLLASAVLVLLLPRKFHEMNYYYLVLLPPLCVLAGLGAEVLLARVQRPRTWATGLIAVGLLLSLRYSVKPAFMTPDEDRAVVAAGNAAAEWSHVDQRVITMHGSTIDLLYYSGRRGWNVPAAAPDFEQRIATCVAEGARIVVVADSEPLDRILERPIFENSKLVERGDGYAVYRLRAEAGFARSD